MTTTRTRDGERMRQCPNPRCDKRCVLCNGAGEYPEAVYRAMPRVSDEYDARRGKAVGWLRGRRHK